MKKLLITGGSGFVGKNLIKEINGEYDIIITGRHQCNDLNFIYWDFQEEIFPEFPKDIDIIIHLGGAVGANRLKQTDYYKANVLSTIKLIEFAEQVGVKKLIYASTGGVYKNKEGKISEDDPCEPRDDYSLTKYIGEMACSKSNIAIVTILRLFFPYGPGQQPERLIPRLTETIKNEKTVNLNNEYGSPLINPVYISDLCFYISHFLKHDIPGIFNVGGSEVISIKGLCEIIGNIQMRKVHYKYGQEKQIDLIGDINRIIKATGYRPCVNLVEGLKKTITAGEYCEKNKPDFTQF